MIPFTWNSGKTNILYSDEKQTSHLGWGERPDAQRNT